MQYHKNIRAAIFPLGLQRDISVPPHLSATNAGMTSTAHVLGIALGVLAWSGVVLKLWLTIGDALDHGQSIGHGIVDYLGYFTILTNLFVALVLTLPLLAPLSRLSRFLAGAQARACAVASIVLVSIGYHFLLRDVWVPGTPSWFEAILLHYVIPTLYVLYWLLALPKQRMVWWSPVVWCLYPIAYFVYTLLRGLLINRYPYSFFDVNKLGYGRSLENALGLLLLFIIISAVLVTVSNVLARRRLALLSEAKT